MQEFVILNKLNVVLHPPKAPDIIEVIWQPPIFNWIKCNTNGSSNNNNASCGGIFRNKDADFLLCFDESLRNGNALFAEMSGAMRSTELTKQYNWNNLWLEADSYLVIRATTNKSLVPWILRNRWNICLQITKTMNFIASHVYREGNKCADTLANISLFVNHLIVWLEVPICIRVFFIKNKLGMPNFRFVHH